MWVVYLLKQLKNRFTISYIIWHFTSGIMLASCAVLKDPSARSCLVAPAGKLQSPAERAEFQWL